MKATNLRNTLIGLGMSVMMLGSQAMPVMAAPTTGTDATGNVLDYYKDTVVVPTTIKIALNPNGYDITTKYVKTEDTELDEDKTYYTLESNTYTAVAEDDLDEDDIDTYYEMKTSDAQVVSLNYGIASKSTEKQDVTVELKADYTKEPPKNPIVFVETEEEAQEYNETSNPTGAKKGQYKMYLAVASATAAPTIDAHYIETEDKEYVSTKEYYTLEGGKYVKASISAFADGTTYYEKTTEIGKNTDQTELSDVNMTAATSGDGVIAFAESESEKAKAAISYKLDAAKYTLKDGMIIDFDTTQEDLEGLLEMSKLGDVTAFTITGSINPDANWTVADATAIKFTPIYTIEEATETEVAVTGGGYKQVTIPAKTVEVTIVNKGDYTGEDTTKTMTVGADPIDPDTVSGYGFDGYYTDATLETAFEGKVDATTTTLYAKWTASKVNVTVTNKGDYTGEATTVQMTVGADPVDPDDVEGYTFKGYYTDAALETAFEGKVAADTTELYAKWEANAKIMTSNGNGGYYYDFSPVVSGTLTALNVDGYDRPAVITNGNAHYSQNVEGRFYILATAATNLGLNSGDHTVIVTIGGSDYTLLIKN